MRTGKKEAKDDDDDDDGDSDGDHDEVIEDELIHSRSTPVRRPAPRRARLRLSAFVRPDVRSLRPIDCRPTASAPSAPPHFARNRNSACNAAITPRYSSQLTSQCS